MTAKHERMLAGLAMGTVILAWFAVIMSLYYVPRLVALWAELGQPLSPAQRLLIGLSGLTEHGFGVLAPALLLATVAALAWRIRAVRRARAVGRV